MNRVLQDRYSNPEGVKASPDSTTLLQVLRADGRDLLDSLEDGREKLHDLLSLRVDDRTSIVTLSVDSRYPDLAADVANRFVRYLNDFNASSRQSQGRERRRFLEGRLVEAERELGNAEDELKFFYQRNRTWDQSPQLRFQEQRLNRRLQISQDLYLTIRREFEDARIEEVNDTPVITVISYATSPREKTTPKPLVIILLATILAAIISVLSAIVVDYLAQAAREGDDEYREFRDQARKMREALKSRIRPGSRAHPRDAT